MNGLCSGYGNVDFITCMGERTDQSSRIVLKINRKVRKTRQEGYLEDCCGIWFLVLCLVWFLGHILALHSAPGGLRGPYVMLGNQQELASCKVSFPAVLYSGPLLLYFNSGTREKGQDSWRKESADRL